MKPIVTRSPFRVGCLALGCWLIVAMPGQAQELLRNGNFVGNLSGWDLHVSSDYAKDAQRPGVDARGEGLVLSGISSDHHHADGSILLSQDVNIEKGKKYRFTMEIRGDQDRGVVSCLIYLPLGGRAHELSEGIVTHLERRINLKSEWQTIDVEFEGKFGRNDVPAIKQQIRGAIQVHPEWDRDRKKHVTDNINWKANGTRLDFRLAKAAGNVHIRNVSIQRIP
ncbi:MAG TPA: carbohydrate binding domain-containing protein [Kiritimatiellia bacterium]|nr:carbohydrate binding domain-containing protein [Kiritimatiellia bacterium]HMO99696.1 carbohydrate binding domain-containing protein [Kiritimatiellia bacterium]HMP96130.1 carbohydrate binding domain-containing protein [Kiritimatiellia bacterium]